MYCCRKKDPFHGLKLGSCLTLRNELSEETCVLTKQEILLGKGTRVESSRVREPRRTALPRGLWLTVLGFMVMGLVSGLSLANHSDSESFLVMHALFTFIKRLFSSSSLSAIRVVSSAYLRLLIFLPAI